MRGIPAIACVALLAFAMVQPIPVLGASAATPSGVGEAPRGVPSAPVKIATGADSSADGYLELSPDEYGSFGAFGIINGVTEDLFKPAGLSLQQTTFTSGFLLFIPGTSPIQQELLSNQQEWRDTLLDFLDTDSEITAANVASDTNGDTVDDTLVSSVRVFGTDTDLGFDVIQNVASLGGGVSQLRQDYTITNNGPIARTFTLVRSYDGDLLWDSDFSNDEVGTTMHSAGLGPFVYMQEANVPGTTGMTLSSSDSRAYYGGKNGIEPEGGGPPYGFGTDVQIWDENMLPVGWTNHIAGVGYDTDGNSGEFPPGVIDPADGFVGLEWEITLNPGESRNLTVFHTYGQNTPGGCLLTAQIPSQIAVAGTPLRVRVALKHRRQQTVTVPFVIWLEDRQGNVLARETTQEYTLDFGETLRFVHPLMLPQDLEAGRYRVMAGVSRMLQGTAHTSHPVEISVQP